MKKVLIIAYYWPPAGGPGVQRWVKFVKYLQEFNIEPVVYIPRNPNYPILDKSLEAEVPANIRILRKEIVEPYALAGILSKKDTNSISSGIIKAEKEQTALQKAMLFIRGNYFIPDARKFWVKPSVKFLDKILKNEHFDVLITTGPPHSLHLIGLKLRKKHAIKWIADFRDPWTKIGYHKKLRLTETARKKHAELESKVLQNGDHIITTSFTTQKEFKSKTSKKVSVITNGFDEELNFSNKKPDKFRISHVGSLLSGRNPSQLWQALQELVQENKEFKNELELCLAGKISEEVLHNIHKFGLKDYLEVKGYLSHSAAIEIQHNSAALLLIEIDSEETRGIIPGKLFEYLAAQRPIIGVGPTHWDVERILNTTKAGQVFKYSEKIEMKSYLLDLFKQYKSTIYSSKTQNLEKYTRKNLTAQLANLIEHL